MIAEDNLREAEEYGREGIYESHEKDLQKFVNDKDDISYWNDRQNNFDKQ